MLSVEIRKRFIKLAICTTIYTTNEFQIYAKIKGSSKEGIKIHSQEFIPMDTYRLFYINMR